jgi:outer membrane lipoprotein-sorting protein
LRFDYRRPENKVAMVNGTETLLWIEADDYTERGTLDSQNDLLVTLLTGDGPLRDLFEPEIDMEPVRRGQVRLRLLPILDQEAFMELILTVPTDGNGLDAVEVLDAAGNRMLYRFSRLRRNAGVPADIFEFSPPGN